MTPAMCSVRHVRIFSQAEMVPLTCVTAKAEGWPFQRPAIPLCRRANHSHPYRDRTELESDVSAFAAWRNVLVVALRGADSGVD